MRPVPDGLAALIGIVLCVIYVGVALASAQRGGDHAIRPLYEGPCPPEICPPCPPTCLPGPTFTPYNAPDTSPSPRPGSTSTQRPWFPWGWLQGILNRPQQPAPSRARSFARPASSVSTHGAGGGQAESSDGELLIVIPAGAVSGPTTFGIQAVQADSPAPPPDRPAVTRVWDVTATSSSGEVVSALGKPIRIVFRYRGEAPQFIAYWDGQEWVNLDTTVDPTARTATASTSQLSAPLPVVQPKLELAAFGSAAGTGPPAPTPSGPAPVLTVLVVLMGLAPVAVTTYIARTRFAPADTPGTPRGLLAQGPSTGRRRAKAGDGRGSVRRRGSKPRDRPPSK